jgi:hypothetical protein
MARNPHPLAGEYRTLASGRKVWIDERGVAHFVTPQGNLTGARRYDPADYEPEDPRISRAEDARDYPEPDEAREWGGIDFP